MNLGDDSFAQRLGSLGADIKTGRTKGSGANVVRHAVRNGRRVVTFRATETHAGTTVECGIHPSDSDAPPQTVGPYTFTTSAEARSFGDDLMRALDYLGCEDSDSVEVER